MEPVLLHPHFITLEGGEGVGKSTALSAARDALQRSGHTVLLTREPGGTPMAERIRALLLENRMAHSDDETLAPETELLLMFAARAQHVREVIRPALQRGIFVICDRFTDSSYAYQGAGRGLDPGWIADLENRAVGIRPGLTLLLDMDVRAGRARARGRDLWPDRIESERDDFFERVRENFLRRAAAEPGRFRIIDAAQPLEHVAHTVSALVSEWSGAHGR